MSTATTTTASNAATMDASAQQTRKKEIVKRLNEISLPVFKIQPKRKATSASAAASTDKAVVLVPEKTEDTHWNFLLKEMQWLSADFTAERKRHVAASKKMATSVAVYCAGAHQRDARAIADATAKRRKLAAKLSRECVVKWWGKLDRVITYKQKIRYDQSRADAMNQQLVKLVHQTEKYTASLGSSKRGGAGSGSLWSIEQALSSTQGTRRSKQRVRDYARLLHDEKASGGDGSVSTNNNNHFLYGKSTEDSGLSSDATWYSHDNDDDDDDERHTAGSRSGDDESTMRAAEKEEEREPRKQARNESNDHSMDEEDEDENDTRSFVADPVELLKLQQESTMDIDLVLERLRQEAGQSVGFHKEEDDAPGAEGRPDPGSDADDDMDASDVEDYDNRNAQKEDDDEEFVVDGDAPDDERTMEQEEQLPPESTADEELSLLQQENELTVDELRERYRLLADQALLQYNDDGEEEKVKELTSDDPEDIDPENQEYEPEEELDDERTMEAEEKLGRDMTHEEELATLKRESEMSVEQLRDLYRGMNGNDESVVAEESGSETQDSAPPAKFHELLESVEDHENDEEFYPDDNAEKDDETTMEIEEQLGPEMSAEQEIALLQKESEMSVSELRLLYQPVDAENDQEHGIIPLKRKTSQSIDELGSEKSRQHARLDEVDKIQPSEEIDMKIMASRPFLIPSWVKLREYQHIGLNWLVSLQERRLNGILADEMGLGKTLQTIALLAYLAAYKGIWGPHLIVVPTSVILNWETELKRFCPALKVLCYYGSAKRRKELRTGWTKPNWHHVVITSYQLVVQDSFAFKRKRWYYLVLDEAQHIKNFQSQRWQTLIGFNTQRRLLLTGTPLQNNLMELWSLLHFLMPYIFRSRIEFSFWFANPMSNIIEGTSSKNDDVIHRLHGIIRPFVLRRLKKDVETQMPGKFEHILKCHLSRRQMFIYEEFMARSSTRQALKGGNFMGMMNVLMQLRKVCNHPDLFEPRSVITPFIVDSIVLPMAMCVSEMSDRSSALDELSCSLVSPLWSGSEDRPSIHAGLRHDTVESDELLKLEASLDVPLKSLYDATTDDVSSALGALAEAVRDREHQDHVDNTLFLNFLNARRCRASPCPFSHRLVDLVLVPKPPLQHQETDCLSTPSHLLAMRRDQMQRANDMNVLIKRFVFAVPKVGARRVVMDSNRNRSSYQNESTLSEILWEPLEACLRPFRNAHTRLTSFFPDKELVQFDAGKLQALAELLRERKRGGHKVLIFTQMSKMLDILEAFLNMNGHTYVRLDGGTSIDQRQRLMDRFNSDPKIFCFILSTRSGGTGVNLVGADTVVFYDSDWNPAQDAQAQDRAHRIGQTREVHIFRLITQHTIEENILLKAKQKRNLDILVMDKGNFDASQLQRGTTTEQRESVVESNQVHDLYTKGGLRAILGVSLLEDDGAKRDDDTEKFSNDQIEKTMISLEDVDDANALRGARIEAAEELQEFDETIEYKKDSDAEDDDERKTERVTENVDSSNNKSDDVKNVEKELERELAAWQDKVGMDASAIEDTLSPVERYGLRFHEMIDPYFSIFAVLEYRRKIETEEEKTDELDIDKIENEKELEEIRAFDEGDLLSTNPRPEDLIRQRNLYFREKARIFGNKKRRKLTGENWECRTDEIIQHAYWYNVDTGEAVWEKPRVVLEMEAYSLAYERKWDAIPMKPLIQIVSFLTPYPERMLVSEVCSHWRRAATDSSFVRHVYPVEQGAYTIEASKMEYNHFRTIEDAMAVAIPGDTIELADGHFWQNSDLVVDIPLRFVGDESNPSNVTIEMSGTIVWQAAGGFIEGITFRRPKLTTGGDRLKEMLLVDSKGKVDVVHSLLDNESSNANVVTLYGPGFKGRWENVVIQHGKFGISIQDEARFNLFKGVVSKNIRSGVLCESESDLLLVECKVEKNGCYGIELKSRSKLTARYSRIAFNREKALSKDGSCSTICSGNVCSQSSPSAVPPPGFQFLSDV